MKLQSFLIILLFPLFSHAQSQSGTYDTRWGDQGNGTYANPVLCADYSDPDVIRVGQKYYMTCSEFHYMGMPILESTDMVNWRIIAQIYDHIDLPMRNGYLKCAEVSRSRIYKCKEVTDIDLAGYQIIYTLLGLMTDAVLHPEKSYSQLLLQQVSTQPPARRH